MICLTPLSLYGSVLPCNVLDIIEEDREYFQSLLASWPYEDFEVGLLPVRTGQIGIIFQEPQSIVSVRALGTSWLGESSSPDILEQASREIDLVTWGEFKSSFRSSVGDFRVGIGNQDYAMFIPEEVGDIGGIKSNHFFSGKAIFEEGLRPRMVVSHVSSLATIKNLVIIDDASYSGFQLSAHLDEFFSELSGLDDIHVHLVIPYVSRFAKDFVENRFDFIGVKLHWYDTGLVKAAGEVKWQPGSFSNIDRDLHLTIFEHKLADSVSTFPILVKTRDGDFYSNSDQLGIEKFKPVYKDSKNFLMLTTLLDIANQRSNFLGGLN